MATSFEPAGLLKNVSATLFQCLKRVENEDVQDLLLEAQGHLAQAHEINARTGMVNIAVAEAIVDVFRAIHEEWQTISPIARPWCKGMMAYFTAIDDDEADFASLIGFDDDVEVINACLKFASREDLCIELDGVSLSSSQKTKIKSLKRPTGQTAKPPITPGQRVVCRDAEWLVTRVDITEHKRNNQTGKTELEHAVYCVGVDDLVRGHEAIFLTQLDAVTPVDPAETVNNRGRTTFSSIHGCLEGMKTVSEHLNHQPIFQDLSIIPVSEKFGCFQNLTTKTQSKIQPYP